MDTDEIMAILDELNSQEESKIKNVKTLCFFIIKPYLENKEMTLDEFCKGNEIAETTSEELQENEQWANKIANRLNNGR